VASMFSMNSAQPTMSGMSSEGRTVGNGATERVTVAEFQGGSSLRGLLKGHSLTQLAFSCGQAVGSPQRCEDFGRQAATIGHTASPCAKGTFRMSPCHNAARRIVRNNLHITL
jgi:hypothetical protein